MIHDISETDEERSRAALAALRSQDVLTRNEGVDLAVGIGASAVPGFLAMLEGPETGLRAPVKIDCAARLHVCHAVCCKLDFALSIPEVESGSVKWDLGRPHFIRHDSQAACVHLDSHSGGHRIYEDRPGVCKGYSCAADPRIWNDFEKMELNQEWIDANVSQATEPHLVAALMHRPDRLTELGGSERLERIGVEQ